MLSAFINVVFILFLLDDYEIQNLQGDIEWTVFLIMVPNILFYVKKNCVWTPSVLIKHLVCHIMFFSYKKA